MESEQPTTAQPVARWEAGLLNKLSAKYAGGTPPTAAMVRSYLIAAVVIGVMFAVSRYVPWWGVALVAVEVLGLLMFHQYKRFARLKVRLLIKLWAQLRPESPAERPKASPDAAPSAE